MAIIAVVILVLAVLLLNEWWWRSHSVHNEISRKFVHITVGSFVAFWPFFLSWNEIRFLSGAFLVVVLISKYLKLFQAIHSVQRPTWGEIFFAAAVGIITFLTQDPWVYAAALLLMSLADGLAAIVGVQYGMRHRYAVFGATKSIVGTVTFGIVSFAILIILNQHIVTSMQIGWIIAVSLLASLIENIGVRGLDNLLIPVMVALVLAR